MLAASVPQATRQAYARLHAGSNRHNAFAEAHRNLRAKVPHALPTFALIAELMVSVPEPAAACTEAARMARVVAAPVLGAALQCRAQVFATGDARHFGHLFGKRIDGVLVQFAARCTRPPCRACATGPRTHPEETKMNAADSRFPATSGTMSATLRIRTQAPRRAQVCPL
jgi:hypothetical protein